MGYYTSVPKGDPMNITLTEGCTLKWESITHRGETYDGCVRDDKHIYCYVTKEQDNKIGVYYPKWEWFSVCYSRLVDGEWEEDTNLEECYYPGLGDGVEPEESAFTGMEEGMKADVHRRRYAYFEMFEDGEWVDNTWDNGESYVDKEVIMKNGVVVPYEEV